MDVIYLGRKGQKVIWNGQNAQTFPNPNPHEKCVELIALAQSIEELQVIYWEMEDIPESNENLYEIMKQEAEQLNDLISETYNELIEKDWDQVSTLEDAFWEVIDKAMGEKEE